MADFLAALCDSDPSNPFPLWQNGSVGYCFTQLVLNVVPHAALAFASACYLNTPRSRWQNFAWSWECRIIISFVMLALFLIDVVAIIFFPNLNTLWLEVLVDSVAVVAWLVHGLAMIALSRSQYGRSLGPTVLMIFAILPAPALIIILVADCQNGQVTCSEYLSSWLRFILISAELSLLLAYIVVLVASHSRRDEQGSEREPLLQGVSTGPEEQIAAEEGTSWVSRLFYFWMNPLMKQGYNRQIAQPNNVYQLPPKLRTETIEELYRKCWQRCALIASKKETKQPGQKPQPDRSRSPHGNSWSDRRWSGASQEESTPANKDTEVRLLSVLHKAFGFRYYSLGILKFMGNMLGFAGPLLLNLLVSFMESGTKQMTKGIWYTLGLFLSTFAGAAILNQFNYQVMMVGMSVRAALISAIYRKALRVNATTLSRFSVGEIVNFMSTDTDRIVNFFPSFHEVWSLPFQFSITLYLLYQQVGVAFLGGLILGLLLVPINKIIANIIMENNKKMLGHKDSRVMLMTEVLFGMRIIKFYTWEDHFIEKVDNYRKKELHHLRIIKYLDAVCVYMWAALPVVISIVTFVTYTLMGHQLTAAKVFTALALVGMLIMPLNNFPWVLNGILQAKVSLDRIQRFLLLSDQDLRTYYRAGRPDDPNSAIELHNATFSWKPSETSDDQSNGNGETEQDSSLMLLNLNLMLTKGQLIGIVGKVGCGKSSLLAAIMGELNRLEGEVYISTQVEGFGLAAQESWIQFATIRENILFGNQFDAKRYREVIEACALLEDLEVLPNGDQTSVGESGVTLSGGQKARIALARAVYMDKDVYLLDDPLAAVDADVANRLMKNCILGSLKNKTVILCTHRTEFLEEADMVVMMENGRIVKTGTPEEVLKTEEENAKTKKKSKKKAAAKEKGPEVDEKEMEEEQKEPAEETMEVQLEAREDEDEEKKVGTVALNVYRSYWLSIGRWLAFLILFSMFLMQATRNLSDWWLSHWISHLQNKNGSIPSNHSTWDYSRQKMRFIRSLSIQELSPDVKLFLIIFGGIAAANTAFTAVRAFLFACGAIHAAVVIHNKLLLRVMKATTSFLDTTPIGRIVNRFSTDLYSVDDTLPFILNIFLATLYGLLGMVLMISYSLPWIMLILVPLGIIYFYLQRYYRFTSRELKRLTAITLSPIYTQFSETLKGLTTVRASRAIVRFEKENSRRLELNQRCLYAANTAMQWLDIRLQMIAVTVVTSIAVIAVIEHSLSRGSPGLVGLALSYALSITNLLSGAISSFTQTETQMVSVERLDEYTTEIPSEPQDDSVEVSSTWPQRGLILFQDVVLVYRPGLPTVLNGINVKINPGEKVGIVGRTGSGKSSLFLALFRMVELTEGQIFIDSVDTRTVSLLELRSRMAIIPQDPFLFSGTVRENLDPLTHHTDQELWDVLHQCHLLEVTHRMGGLNAELGERGKNLSIGQKQLMCLARALLTKSKILCIDEATASVDQKTDQLLQETIRRQFAEKTVLTIAHRINTIMDSDRVLVMDAGTLKEFDSPDVLSEDRDSYFYHLIHSDEL
ncbi:ATP-binding cassette sub-family C member 10 [Pristis pectinata]|uniref:ATP-binding cassette sub-family C member 10 n=1 Tax=Pristis pectinata TaxID=685728 RepID=UPI00223CE7C8|nr:ATP-binding cassette sub-family C member 10 [Pristis pectinata]